MKNSILEKIKNKKKNVLKIAFYGDSVFASGFKDINHIKEDDKYEEPYRNTNLDSFQRMLYDYLDYNKPIFRNALHRDWVLFGAWEEVSSNVEPNFAPKSACVNIAKNYEKLKCLNGGETGYAQITFQGHESVVFVFEGGAKGSLGQTGGVEVLVSENGDDFRSPDEFLKGKLMPDGSYEIACKIFNTSFISQNEITEENIYAPIIELHYNGLDKNNKYTFKLKKYNKKEKILLWGCYSFTGQTLTVHNESKPGRDWHRLSAGVYSNIIINESDAVILQAPMYHDVSLEQAKDDAKRLIRYLKSNGVLVVLCSCTPAGVTPTGRKTVILGDENSAAYVPGENFYNTYNNRVVMITNDLSNNIEYPQKGDIYSILDENSETLLECRETIRSKELIRTEFLIKNGGRIVSEHLTLTKKNEKGENKITYTGCEKKFTMEQHRQVMMQVAADESCIFLDLFQHFKNISTMNDEKLSDVGYDMPKYHRLYKLCTDRENKKLEYPLLKKPYIMNCMTNYFNLEDGHHLEFAAHEEIFRVLKSIF